MASTFLFHLLKCGNVRLHLVLELKLSSGDMQTEESLDGFIAATCREKDHFESLNVFTVWTESLQLIPAENKQINQLVPLPSQSFFLLCGLSHAHKTQIIFNTVPHIKTRHTHTHTDLFIKAARSCRASFLGWKRIRRVGLHKFSGARGD